LKFNDHANSDILRDICLAMLFIVWFFWGWNCGNKSIQSIKIDVPYFR